MGKPLVFQFVVTYDSIMLFTAINIFFVGDSEFLRVKKFEINLIRVHWALIRFVK